MNARINKENKSKMLNEIDDMNYISIVEYKIKNKSFLIHSTKMCSNNSVTI